MMGSKGDYSGVECDAFSLRARRMIGWRRGEVRKIKRAFAKRARKSSRLLTQAVTSEQVN